jgi:hypothetical protein
MGFDRGKIGGKGPRRRSSAEEVIFRRFCLLYGAERPEEILIYFSTLAAIIFLIAYKTA